MCHTWIASSSDIFILLWVPWLSKSGVHVGNVEHCGPVGTVRTVPYTLRRLVVKEVNTQAWDTERPPCFCTAQYKSIRESYGTITMVVIMHCSLLLYITALIFCALGTLFPCMGKSAIK